MKLEHFITKHYVPYFRLKAKNDKNYDNDIYIIDIIKQYPISAMDISEIKKKDLVEFLYQLEKDRDISRSTVNRYRTKLSAIFTYAVELEVIDTNVVRSVKKYKEYSVQNYLKGDEIDLLLAECLRSRNKELYSIVVLALNTGLRKGEIQTLKKSNFQGDRIVLSGKDTKNGLPRIVPINETVQALLDEHEFLSDGSMFKSFDFDTAYRNAVKRAGITKVRFHDLRRTFATLLYYLKVDVFSLAILLGHSSIVTTQRYLGVDENKLLDSVQKIGFK